MILKEIEIINFRNIEHIKFKPQSDLTIICGQNGQGKTNLLESIWMLTGAKSFRSVKDSFLIKSGENAAYINAKVSNANNKTEQLNSESSEIKIAVIDENNESSSKKGRFAHINGVDYKRAINIAGIFNEVVFEPNHLRLVKGSPENRRKFLDAALCQLYPSYISALRKYTRILTQKNALLKQYYKHSGAGNLLDVYNENLAQSGEFIVNKRKEYLKLFCKSAIEHHAKITGNKESFKIDYKPCFSDSLIETLNKSKEKDINAGFCTSGPHREDLLFSINDSDAKIFASQGQQRSIVLSLKLAEAQMIFDITSEKPIVLLDDVLSELDENRKNYLLSEITGMQTIITTCESSAFADFNIVGEGLPLSNKVYYVENGKLI